MKAAQQQSQGGHDARAAAFGPFVLDAARGRLLREGRPVALTPRAFAVLAHLVARAGELVEKAELLEAVWPHVVVEESNLSQAVYLIRRALDESPEDHRYVVTVPGRGYRFVAPVTRVDPAGADEARADEARADAACADAPGPAEAPVVAEAPRIPAPAPAPSKASAASVAPHAPAIVPPPARRWWVAAGVAALAVAVLAFVEGRPSAAAPPPPSVAVLPFVDLSPTHDQGFLADGLAEDVLDLLADTSGLRVVARTSSFQFRGDTLGVDTVARRLGVTHVLEGSVRRSDGRLRVTARLFASHRAEPVWSASYDRDARDALRVQSEIAAEVAHALQVRLQDATSVQVARTREVDPRAYEAELRGRFLVNRRAPGDFELAAAAYREALAVDPRLARAWSGLATVTYLRAALGQVPRNEGFAVAINAARRAIELDPPLAEAHVRLALSYCWLGQHAAAEAELARAKAIDPDDPLLLGVQAGAAAEEGRYAEAIALQKRSAMFDPLSVVALENLATYELHGGDLDAARLDLIKLYGLAPATSQAAAMLGQIAILQRDFAAARDWFERAPGSLERAQGRALVAVGLGQKKEAEAALAALRALAGDANAVLVAEVYAYRGDSDAAFEWLRRALNPTGPTPPDPLMWEYARSPFFAALHADPRWREHEAAARG